MGGAVTGAVLGGLLLGPFGAILGGNLGANIGAERREIKEVEAEIRRQGLTPELIEMVQECADGLQQAEASLGTTKAAYNATLQRAADLDAEASELYNLAAAAMNDGNEDAARRRLVERKQVQARFQEAKSDAAAAKVGQCKLNPGLKAPGFKV